MGLVRECVQDGSVTASAPCRLDMGGTLDLSTFYLPLRHLHPCTFNAALEMRTQVRLEAHVNERVVISSRGFEPLEVDLSSAPLDHPLGLMLAVAAYFQAAGVHVRIKSTSPPRSALGGSSAAAVALIWAFSKALTQTGHPMPEPAAVAGLAHALEQSVAGITCGRQDQLAAAYGGMHAWHWAADPMAETYKRQCFSESQTQGFSQRILVAYCGIPHDFKEINGTWVRGFLSGQKGTDWYRIVSLSRQFISALEQDDYVRAQQAMNDETELRVGLTPHVLDDMGRLLVAAARDHGCGARFTGAGGGGCVWALGATQDQIDALRLVWQEMLDRSGRGRLLEAAVDRHGVL